MLRREGYMCVCMCVCVYRERERERELIHIVVQQKSTQHCKAFILQ